MAKTMLDRIMDVVAFDIGEKKVMNSANRLSLASIAYVLGKPIKNRVMMHFEVYKELCEESVDNKHSSKLEEELYYLAESDPNQLGSKYEALKENSKVLHSKGNTLRLFITRDAKIMKVLAICKAATWHKDERKFISRLTQRINNWKGID